MLVDPVTGELALFTVEEEEVYTILDTGTISDDFDEYKLEQNRKKRQEKMINDIC